MPLISIITVCYNSQETIRKTIESVLAQKYSNFEYVIVDGASKDLTLDIVKEYLCDKRIKIISEKDYGIYDAMNKGISNCTGDIIGILNSDDYYFSDSILTNIASEYQLSPTNIGIFFSDLIYMKNGQVKRYYRANYFVKEDFLYGLMPPHPTVFIKRNLYLNFGLYRTDLKIASDFELLLRYIYINNVSFKYLPGISVVMALGGVSSSGIKSKIELNSEILHSLRLNGIKPNYFKFIIKFFLRISELIFLKY